MTPATSFGRILIKVLLQTQFVLINLLQAAMVIQDVMAPNHVGWHLTTSVVWCAETDNTEQWSRAAAFKEVQHGGTQRSLICHRSQNEHDDVITATVKVICLAWERLFKFLLFSHVAHSTCAALSFSRNLIKVSFQTQVVLLCFVQDVSVKEARNFSFASANKTTGRASIESFVFDAVCARGK